MTCQELLLKMVLALDRSGSVEQAVETHNRTVSRWAVPRSGCRVVVGQ